MKGCQSSMKPILLCLNFLVIALAEMLVSRALPKSLLARRVIVGPSAAQYRLEYKQSSSSLPWWSSKKRKSQFLPLLIPDQDETGIIDRQEGEPDPVAGILRRDVPDTLYRRSPMQAARPGIVRETAARINQGVRDAEARTKAQEAEIAAARERARAMSPPRSSGPSIPVRPITPEQPVPQAQPPRSASPVQRAGSPPPLRAISPPPRAASAPRAASPPPRAASPPPRAASPPPQHQSQGSVPQTPRLHIAPPLPVASSDSFSKAQTSNSEQSLPIRPSSPTTRTNTEQSSRGRLAAPSDPSSSRQQLSSSRSPSPTKQRPPTRQSSPVLNSSPVQDAALVPNSSSARSSSPARKSSPIRNSSPVPDSLPAPDSLPVPNPPLLRNSSPVRNSSPTQQGSPIAQFSSTQQQSSRNPSSTRPSSSTGQPSFSPLSLPQSSSPHASGQEASSIQILSARPVDMQAGRPSPFQTTSPRAQTGTPAALSHIGPGTSIGSPNPAGGSSARDASDPAVLEEALRRSHSLPSVQKAEEDQRLRSVQSASQPSSPRQRSPIRTSQTGRSVSLSDKPQIRILSNTPPSTRTPSAFVGRPLRSALRGSTGNLAGMVNSLEPLHEDRVETPGAGVPRTPLQPLAALSREDPIANPTPGAHSQGLSRANSLRALPSPQRADSLPRGNGVLPQRDGREAQPVQAPRTDRTPPATPNHVRPAPATQSSQNAVGTNRQSLRPNGVAGASSSSIVSLSNQNTANNGDTSNRGTRGNSMRTQLSARMGEASIENELHPGKFATTIIGTVLSGGIVGGIATGINHHSVASIAGGSLAGTCVGLTGIVGTCYFMKNARTTAERGDISFEERIRRGHEALANMRLVNMVPRSTRNAYRRWRGLPLLPETQSGSMNSGGSGTLGGAANDNDDAQPQNSNTPANAASMSTPFALPADPNHPDNLVRRGLSGWDLST